MKTIAPTALVLAVLLAACTGAGSGSTEPSGSVGTSPQPTSSSSAGAPPEELVIGAALSLSGNFSDQGNRILSGYELWRDTVNEAGGLQVGSTRYLVDLIVYDDKSDAQLAGQLTEKLISEDGAQFLLGPFSSAITLQTTAIAERNRVLTIAPAGNSDDIYSRDFKYVFSVLIPASHNQWAVLSLINELKSAGEDLNTVAILAKDDPFGNSVLAGIHERLEADDPDLEIVYEAKYPATATDFTTLLQEVKAADPDVILTASHDADGIVLVKQARELELSPKLFSLGIGPAGAQFREAVGDLGEDILGIAYWLPAVPYSDPLWESAAGYAEAYEEAYGSVPMAYDQASSAAAGELLGLALEKAGSLDADAVREAILSLDVETLWGRYGFDETGQNAGAESAVIQVTDGDPRVLNPDGSDTKVPAWP